LKYRRYPARWSVTATTTATISLTLQISFSRTKSYFSENRNIYTSTDIYTIVPCCRKDLRQSKCLYADYESVPVARAKAGAHANQRSPFDTAAALWSAWRVACPSAVSTTSLPSPP